VTTGQVVAWLVLTVIACGFVFFAGFQTGRNSHAFHIKGWFATGKGEK